MRSDDSPLVLVKGEGVVEAPVAELMFFCSKLETATSIDPMFLEGKEFEDLGGGHLFVYAAFQMPPLITNRDFVYHSVDRLIEESGIGVSFGHSIIHPDVPDKSGFVRAHINASGYVFRPVEGDPTKSFAQYIVHVDPKGWIPTWVVNATAADQGSNMDRMQQHFALKRNEENSAEVVEKVEKKRKKRKNKKKATPEKEGN